MSNKNLFQEAIADAKAVREAALANAKAALEEALTPRLQSMLAAKLNEMEYEGGEEDLEERDFMAPADTADEQGQSGFGNPEQGNPGWMDEELDEDLDLSEILAELDEEYSLDEAKKKKEKEEDEEDEEEEPSEEEEEPSGEGEDELNPKDPDFTEKLKALIQDLIAQEMGGGGEEMPAGDETGDTGDMGDMGDMGGAGNEEDINIDELLAELDALGEDDSYEELEEATDKAKKKKEEEEKKKKAAKEKEMKEAFSTIQTLRNELNEVNLLNAKLLYLNKIFKSKNLNESQKVHVIASFDKATTIKEAKVVFESLSTALTSATKKPIKESLGFASKAAGIAPRKQQIVESNDTILRMQKLANIIK
jgi:hypothetical protein